MRETKDQKIIRLERKSSQLEVELKEVKKQLKTSQRENKAGSAEIERTYKKEIEKLQAKIDEMSKIWETEKSNLEQKLDQANSLCKWYSDQERKRVRKEERERNEWLKAEELKAILRNNDSRLEYFNSGQWCDKYHNDFIDSTTLTLSINPHTGELLNLNGTCELLTLLEGNPYYQQKLEEVKPHLEMDYKEDPEILQLIFDIGMDLYKKLYPDFPFEKYSI